MSNKITTTVGQSSRSQESSVDVILKPNTLDKTTSTVAQSSRNQQSTVDVIQNPNVSNKKTSTIAQSSRTQEIANSVVSNLNISDKKASTVTQSSGAQESTNDVISNSNMSNKKASTTVQRESSRTQEITVDVIRNLPSLSTENSQNTIHPIGSAQKQPEPRNGNHNPDDQAMVRKINILSSNVKQLQLEVRQLQDKIQPIQRGMEESENNLKSQIHQAVSALFVRLSQKAPIITASDGEDGQGTDIQRLPESEAENKQRSEVQKLPDSSDREGNLQQENPGALVAEDHFYEVEDIKGQDVPVESEPNAEVIDLREQVSHLTTGNKDLMTKFQHLSLEVDRLSTENHRLSSENKTSPAKVAQLSAEHQKLSSDNKHLQAKLARISTEYRDLLGQYNAHRCANNDELEVLDSEIKRKFDDLQKTIAYLFDDCVVENLTTVTVQKMSKYCKAVVDPIWWGLMEEEPRKLWLASLLANLLHREFFEWPFFDLEDERQEDGLVAFEEMLLGENSGVSERDVLEWRARTFRIAEFLRRKQGNSLAHQTDQVIKNLENVFGTTFDHEGKNLKILRQVCEKALHCSFLLRRSKSKYVWEQMNLPADLSGRAVVRNKIHKPEKIEGVEWVEFDATFNVFGEVVKWYRGAGPSANMAEKRLVISKAVVAMPAVGK